MDNYNELYHYGVKGMKWGIRRDARVLANHRRNVAVKNIKDQYSSGKITKSQRDSNIAKENAKKKKYISDIDNQINNTYSKNQLSAMRKNIAKQTIDEVPNHTLKKGLTTVNQIVGGVHTGQMVGAGLVGLGMLAANPVTGTALLAGGAVGAAAEVGAHYLAQLGIDKLS